MLENGCEKCLESVLNWREDYCEEFESWSEVAEGKLEDKER